MADGRVQSWLDERFVPAPHNNRLDHVSCAGAETKRSFVSRIYEAMDNIIEDPPGQRLSSPTAMQRRL
jgi:2,3-bisphosphoglycerate-dependent phosphoglycerate mutase